MEALRRRWRLVVGIVIVVAAIVGLVFAPGSGVSMGITLLTFFLILILVITGVRKGSGGVDAHRYQSGNTGNNNWGL